MASEADNRAAFEVQAGYCLAMDAPITAAVARACAAALDRGTETGRRVLDWTGDPVADALVLRLVGGLRALDLSDADAGLRGLFAGEVAGEAGDGAAIVAAALRTHDACVLPWLDGPPQTNEVGRSAGLVAGMLALADGRDTVFEVLEIGSSGGLNLLVDRLRYDLGGVAVGPVDAPVVIRPEWRGVSPPAAVLRFAPAPRGVDVRPLDLADPAAVARLRAYIWADAPERSARLDGAAVMVRAAPVALERGDAAEWVEARLAERQAAGVTRLLMHSVVWQYLGAGGQARIEAAMAAAGARATPERPLAWVAMEPDRGTAEMWITSRRWPDRPEPRRVARAQSHGAWVQGFRATGEAGG